jgi:hypothetical protein
MITTNTMSTTMKTLTFALLILCTSPLMAQEETLLGSGPIEHGGYGALVVKLTTVNNQLGVLVGGRGGWIINHTFAIGAAGYGLVNDVTARVPGPLGQPYVNLGYGGLDLEYIAHSNEIVHYSIHTLIGGGAVGYRPGRWHEFSWSIDDDDWDMMYEPFFVVEPGMNIDVNITTWFRLSAGGAYRFVGGTRSDAVTRKDITGPSGMISFRFGSF